MSVTSSVCLIAKNESAYLVEWIAYHRLLEFNEVIVYENNSTDDSAQMLQTLARAGKIIHRPWTLGANESPQITAYQDAIRRAKTDWILFIDADEFLVLHDHDTVNAFLEPFHQNPEITAVGVNWRIFGDSGHQRSDGRPVMQRFTQASEPSFVVNAHLKSFMRTSKIRNLVHMHMCETSGSMVHASGAPLVMLHWGLSTEIDFRGAQINHYYTKTVEEYQKKKLRGQGGAGDHQPDLKYWYNDDSFHGHNKNDVEDRSILRRFDKVSEEMSTLEAHFEFKRKTAS